MNYLEERKVRYERSLTNFSQSELPHVKRIGTAIANILSFKTKGEYQKHVANFGPVERAKEAHTAENEIEEINLQEQEKLATLLAEHISREPNIHELPGMEFPTETEGVAMLKQLDPEVLQAVLLDVLRIAIPFDEPDNSTESE